MNFNHVEWFLKRFTEFILIFHSATLRLCVHHLYSKTPRVSILAETLRRRINKSHNHNSLHLNSTPRFCVSTCDPSHTTIKTHYTVSILLMHSASKPNTATLRLCDSACTIFTPRLCIHHVFSAPLRLCVPSIKLIKYSPFQYLEENLSFLSARLLW